MDTKPVPLRNPVRATPPPRLGGFDAVRCLGGGAQGEVWLLNPQDGSAPVAGKFLLPVNEQGSSAEALRHNESQITHEWRVLTQFRHDHLLPVHRLARDDQGAPVLLMDFAAGGSLAQIIRARGPLSVGETVTVLTPMGQVLAFLHSRGAVHGDVSPGNVLLTAAGKPVLADFGCGRLLGQAAGSLAGTPGFHCRTDTRRDEAADVFSLACVGWYALTGRSAPRTANRMPLAATVPDVPAELVAALEAGLQEDPTQRPTAAAFAQAVFRSAWAEPLMLGNAVHPSVLADLPTRRDLKAKKSRRPSWRGRRLIRNDARPARQHSHAADAGLRVGSGLGSRWRRIGQQRRLAHLWTATGNGQRRRGPLVGRGESGWRTRRGCIDSTKWRWRAVAIVTILAVVAAMGMFLLSGRAPAAWIPWLPGHQGQAIPSAAWANPDTDSHRDDVAEADFPVWASPLPESVQTGLRSPDATVALAALAWARSYALSTVDADLLAGVNVRDSPVAKSDAAILKSLVEQRHTLTGLESSIADAEIVQSGTPGAVTVTAIVTTSAFAEVDEAGAVIHQQTRAQTQKLAIILAQVDGRWRVAQVTEP